MRFPRVRPSYNEKPGSGRLNRSFCCCRYSRRFRFCSWLLTYQTLQGSTKGQATRRGVCDVPPPQPRNVVVPRVSDAQISWPWDRHPWSPIYPPRLSGPQWSRPHSTMFCVFRQGCSRGTRGRMYHLGLRSGNTVASHHPSPKVVPSAAGSGRLHVGSACRIG